MCRRPGPPPESQLPLIVTVRDTGPGIPEDPAELVRPFVTSKPAGNGLGLALVAKIIGDHGGLIEVDSRPGGTDSASADLPAVHEEPSAPDR